MKRNRVSTLLYSLTKKIIWGCKIPKNTFDPSCPFKERKGKNMSLFNPALATKGMDITTGMKILSRHAYTFVRHSTPRKLSKVLRSELNRVSKKVRLTTYPYILKIESTNIYNLHCAYCHEGRRAPIFSDDADDECFSDRWVHECMEQQDVSGMSKAAGPSGRF